LSKNTRWALAIVGVAILIIAAFAISSGKDDTKAVQEPGQESTTETGPTTPAPAPPQTGSTGSNSGDNSSGGSGTGDNSGNSGGASPDDSGNSGGASPDSNSSDSSGGAEAHTDVFSPVLADGKVQTVIAGKGDTVTIRGLSDSAGEMHIHGYDKSVALKPGTIANLKLKATIDGEFHIEFHLPSGEVQVGTLRVSP
jgi:hypothetical protein